MLGGFAALTGMVGYEYCKGCGLCAAECPGGAIEMEPEPT